MHQHDQPATTIAILGADTVVGSALCALLEGSGYRITPVDYHPTGIVDELLEGADLLLLAPRLNAEAREAFVGAMGKSVPQNADMPVIALCTALEEGLPEEEGVTVVPWPCEMKALVERIEDILAGGPPRAPWPSETGRLGQIETTLPDAPAAPNAPTAGGPAWPS